MEEPLCNLVSGRAAGGKNNDLPVLEGWVRSGHIGTVIFLAFYWARHTANIINGNRPVDASGRRHF